MKWHDVVCSRGLLELRWRIERIHHMKALPSIWCELLVDLGCVFDFGMSLCFTQQKSRGWNLKSTNIEFHLKWPKRFYSWFMIKYACVGQRKWCIFSDEFWRWPAFQNVPVLLHVDSRVVWLAKMGKVHSLPSETAIKATNFWKDTHRQMDLACGKLTPH